MTCGVRWRLCAPCFSAMLRFALALATICLLVAAYYQIQGKLVSDWWLIPDFSHGSLVPFFSAYLVWEKRRMVYGKLMDKGNAAIHFKKAISLAPDSPVEKDARTALHLVSIFGIHPAFSPLFHILCFFEHIYKYY